MNFEYDRDENGLLISVLKLNNNDLRLIKKYMLKEFEKKLHFYEKKLEYFEDIRDGGNATERQVDKIYFYDDIVSFFRNFVEKIK